MVLIQKEIKAVYLWDNKVRPTEYTWPELCFTANTAWSTIQLTKTWRPTSVTLETSTDGENWSTYTIWNTITLSNIWDKVYWRNTSTTDTWFSTDDSNCYKFVMTWSIAWSGDINYLLNKNSTTTLSSWCFTYLFYNCTALTSSPTLPATTLANCCYYIMFAECSNLTTLPSLPALSLPAYCCYYMFKNCSKIKLSSTQIWEYQTAYRIPTTWTWTLWEDSLNYMFYGTWWRRSWTWTPTINRTYYTSNTLV